MIQSNKILRLICHFTLSIFLSVNAGAVTAGVFVTNTPMSTPRVWHTATLMLDGKVMVAGGDSGNGGYVGSVELFDPVSGIWMATNSMANITGYGTNAATNLRAYHTATLLAGGKVLVAGGLGVATLASAQLYDPTTGAWTETGFMNIARYQHAAMLLPNGEVLVTGGLDSFGNSLASAELYDPKTGGWTEVGPMTSTRWQHSMTLLPDGKVLVAGGQEIVNGALGNLLSSTELYDPVAGTWTPSGNLHFGRRDHARVLLVNGKVLVAGGFNQPNSIASAELYDPASEIWADTGALTIARDAPQATLLANGKVLITGGFNSGNNNYLSSAETYDPALGTFSTNGIGVMNDQRWRHTSTLLFDARVLITGGYNGSSVVASTELYNSGNVPTNGSLKVTLSPANAITAGAQWRVDGGTFKTNGAVVTNLSSGIHVVSFKSITGWMTPADQIFTIISSALITNSVSGTYVLNPGALQVNLNPPGAVAAGAEWRVDGGIFQTNGATVTNLSVGSHLISFKTISGWFAPGDQRVTIQTETTTNISATYSLNPGAVQVTINPPGAVAAGALWQVDGGAFLTNGAVLTGLATGNHTLMFNTVSGWATPSNQTITISANTTNLAIGTYVAAAGVLSVTITPSAVINAGRWQVDGGALQSSGAIVNGLSAGNHTVSFSPVVGWITPANQIVNISTTVANTATGTYVLGELIKPTLTFTAPKPGQKWSNSVFTVTGTAKDNVKVAAVFYQLNGLGGWTAASTANNFGNWNSASLLLVPGTNTIRAYAVDTSNNSSTTNAANLVYVLSDRLGIAFNGRGTISPNYSNAVLQIGKNYSMTATAAKGFKFINWSGGAVSASPKLSFNMQSNTSFTVNFLDATRPANVVLTPKANQRLNSELFTATGKASDNVGVSNVWYQLNNNGWSNAITLNNWANWTANLVLVPGTNVIRTYAADYAGNHSLTNSIKFVYVLTDRLMVHFNGKGTLSPNYSNAVLQIGKNYSMTATAAKGFKFINWTGSLATSSSKLAFNMQSNLSFYANFLDTARPTLIIATPKASSKLSNAVFVASGTTSDNVGVNSVWYQLDGKNWNPATLNGLNWSTPNLALLSGSNQIQAFAADAAGNFSLTNKVNFTYTVLPVTDWAPDSLNGLLATVTTDDSNATEKVGFDVLNFAETSLKTNNADFGVGNYLYNKTATNLAQLSLTFTAPPNITNDETQISLVFTNHYSGYFTNENDGESGGISFVIATNFLPGTISGKTIVAIDDANTQTNQLKLLNSTTFTKTSSPGGISAGFYTLSRFSPISGMIAFTFTNPANLGEVVYLQTTFTNATAGGYFLTKFNNLGVVQNTDIGRFKLQ